MTVIGTLWTALTGGTAAAGAAGAAGAGVAASTLNLLQGAGTVFSAIATIGSGVAAKASADTEAAQQRFEAKNEFIAGRETSAALKAELAKTISNQQVAFAAGGVNLGSVSVGEAKKQATADAERELSINADETLTRSLQRQRAARMAAARGNASLFSSIFTAGGQIAGYGFDVVKRGVPA